MSLSQNPPPLFKQENSARVKIASAIISSILLITVDSKFNYLFDLRSALTYLLNPFVELLLLPRDIAFNAASHLTNISELNKKIEILEDTQRLNGETLVKLEQLEKENINLRKLLSLKPRLKIPSINATVRYELPDAYSRKVVVDKGSNHGVKAGFPVMSAEGIIGQVSKVHFLTCEITLISDANLSIPVVLPRAKIKAITRGKGDTEQFKLQYADISANLQIGDEVLTSGLDGIYPSGLLVGYIHEVTPAIPGQFPVVSGKPSAIIGIQHNVLLLQLMNTQNDS